MHDFGVGLHDLDFDSDFILVRTQGGAARRWVRVGMPRVSRQIEKSAFFLFGKNACAEVSKDTEADKRTGPGGTGFFVARLSRTLAGLYHIYAVSNRHVVANYSDIRVNTKSGAVRFLDFEPADWTFSKTDDLAVIDVTDHLEIALMTTVYSPDDIGWVDEGNFLTPAFIEGNDVGIGDHTIMLGLFVDHDGGVRNLPVGRFGNIAAMPNSEAPVSLDQKDQFKRPAYLNDMRSRSGFSGSPVWVWRSPFDDMNYFPPDGFWMERRSTPSAFLRFVGIHRGQFRERTKIFSSESADFIESGDDVEIASAMTVVVPAWEITTLLNTDYFEGQRVHRDTQARTNETASWYA